MLRSKDFIREFPIKYRTDRDVEAPLLLEFLEETKPVSLLDVGAHWSHASYAPEVRKLVKTYDAVDVLPDPQTEDIVDNYYVGKLEDHLDRLPKYDVVTCVSTLEHAGLSTYKGNYWTERIDLFCQCLVLAERVWFSFPVGQDYLYPNELAVVTGDHLRIFEEEAGGRQIKERFFYTQGCQSDHPWYEHQKKDVALKIPFIDFIGCQSLCVMEVR